MLTSETRKTIAIGCVAAAVLCAVAILKWPYGYYVLVRWAVCAGSFAAGVAMVKSRRPALSVAAFALALLYNPVAPVHFKRETWQVLNLVGAGVLAAFSIVVIKGGKPDAHP